jgi:hypothetical protein
MLTDYRRLGALNQEALATTFRVLSAGGAQWLHPEKAPRNLALHHVEQRAIMLSLVAMQTTFVYLLTVSLQ